MSSTEILPTSNHELLTTINTKDSDSGHVPTTSSSSASNSLENVCCIEDGMQKTKIVVSIANKDCKEEEADVEALKRFNIDNEVQTAGRTEVEEDEDFADAADQFSDGSDHDGDNELELRLAETTVVLKMALNNEFNRALEICSQRAQNDLYASLANATLCFLRAALTLEQSDLRAALDNINLSYEVSLKKKRKCSTSILSKLIYFNQQIDYNHYTDEEIHAELVNAESMLLLSLISFLADQSIICFVKGALRIRSCYQSYKECLYILETKNNWSNENSKKHFESGVRMGYGIFNLLMSYLPRKVLKFLEYVGFSGNRTVGLNELDKSIELNDNLRSVFSTLVILTYHSYVENIFGLGDYDLKKVNCLLNENLHLNYPTSAFYYLYLGRYHQMLGQLDKAVETFKLCIKSQNDWKQFHSICHWEIMWCHAIKMNWVKAAKYANLLRLSSKWSAASYTYQYGTFLYAQLIDDEREDRVQANSDEYKRRMQEIVDIIKQVEGLRIRYAGKTIPAEKFAITRSAKFLKQNNRLILPALEFLYIWNVFATMKNSPKEVEALLRRIEIEINFVIKSDNYKDDDIALLLLLKGMCQKQLNRLEAAEKTFLTVVNANQEVDSGEPENLLIKEDKFLIPHCVMELALLKISSKHYEEARHYIRAARNDYTGYLMETIVHFRLHSANRVIKIAQLGNQPDAEEISGQENFDDSVEEETVATKEMFDPSKLMSAVS